MARYSFSVVVYFFSAVVSTLLTNSTSVPCLVESIAAIPTSEVSVISTNCLLSLGSHGLEELEVIALRRTSNSCWCFVDQV